MPLRLIVMGTGDFAVPMLRELLTGPHAVLSLVTQPPRVSPGRRRPHTSAIKQMALDHGIKVLQPESSNAPQGIALLAERHADLFVVAAYGQILSDELLSVPRLGGINLHASLLPKYRGAAPVNWAIYYGETETGVSVIQMQPRVDAGPVLAMESTTIGPDETAGTLTTRLADLGAPLVARVVDQLEAGTTHPIPQDPKLASRAPRIKKQQGAVDWSRTAVQICNHVRAMQPWPTAYTFWHAAGRRPLRMILLQVEPVDSSQTSEPGTVIRAGDGQLFVGTAAGTIAVKRLQLPGKQPFSTAEFLHGHTLKPGDHLGPESTSQRAPDAEA